MKFPSRDPLERLGKEINRLGEKLEQLHQDPKPYWAQRGRSPRLHELQNVHIEDIEDGQTLVYDAATDQLIPGAGGGGLGGLVLEKVFSFGSANLDVIPDLESGHWSPRQDIEVVEIACRLAMAGSTSTQVRVNKNGVNTSTIILVAGDKWHVTGTSIDYVADTDYVSVGVMLWGTGAKGLTVQLRYVLA